MTLEVEEQIRDCIDLCDRYGNPLPNCYSKCDEIFDAEILGCKNACGNIPDPVRNVVDWDVQLRLWFNTGLTEDFTGPPNIAISTEVLLGAPPNTITVDLMEELPEQPISYCYRIFTTITYDDGSCCIFVDSDCILLG